MHTLHQRAKIVFVRERRRRIKHGRGAENRGKGRAKLVADGADQRLAQLFGLCPHPRLGDGARDAEPLERGGGIGEHRVDAAAQHFAVLDRSVPEIDGDDAEFAVLRRHGPDQPDFAAIRCHGIVSAVFRAASGDRLNNRDDLRRNADAGAAGSLPLRPEQQNLALHYRGKMVLDGGMDVGDIEGRRQPPRECIKVGEIDFSLPRDLELAFQAGGELADHHRGESEQDEIEDLVLVLNLKTVARLKEEEGRGQDAAERRDDGRDHAPADCGDQHRDQIERRAMREAGKG